jgi:cellulose synthase/poly-beta-1,6-N-acetylglucosamine synthase-like glycosyltransferase
MLSGFESALVAVYFCAALGLGILGLHRLWTLLLLRRALARERTRPLPAEPEVFPAVAVQLPLYNERYVAERAILAAGALDYPRDRLEIQILDDSTDDTGAIADRAAARLRAEGVNAAVVRRPHREGFKAGALAHGLTQTQGELIAIFDADFAPPSDWLRRIVGEFRDPRVGMVQTAWGYLNADHSGLTRTQADFLQGHFGVEQRALGGNGRFFNFNGTAGVWRRQAIDDAGGWSADTLTEDLDLSYRAQMAGWRFVYRPDAAAPGELPVEWAAFKKQQRRWTKGSIQVAWKLLPSLLFRRGIAAGDRFEALAHLTRNLSYPLLLTLALALPPILVLRSRYQLERLGWADLAALAFGTLSVGLFYYVSQRLEGRGRLAALARVPSLMAYGIALAPNNARAVFEGLLRVQTPFERTAKYGDAATRADSGWTSLAYVSRLDLQTLFEIALAGGFLAVAGWVSAFAPWPSWPFLLLLAWGFALSAALGLSQTPPPGWLWRRSLPRETAATDPNAPPTAPGASPIC